MPEEVSQFKIVLRRFLRHKLAVGAMMVMGLIIMIALFAPVIPLLNRMKSKSAKTSLRPDREVKMDAYIGWVQMP